MALLEQPPPDAPAPPPDEAVTKSRNQAFLIFSLGFISVIVSIAYMTQPVILRAARSPHRTQALNNIRQIGMSLSEFDAEYGKFPDASTIAAVARHRHEPRARQHELKRTLPPTHCRRA